MTVATRSLVLFGQAPQGNSDGTSDTGPMNSLWFYPTDEAYTVVATAGFFNNERKRLRVGDIIIVSCASNKGGLYTVSAVPTSGNVTVVASVLS